MLSWLRQGTRWEKCNLNRNRLHHNHDHHYYLHSCFSGGGGGWHHAWQHGKGGLDFGDDGDNDDIDEVDVDVQQRSWWNQWCWWRWWRGRGSWGSWRWGPRHCNRDQNSFRWWWSIVGPMVDNHRKPSLFPTIPFNGDRLQKIIKIFCIFPSWPSHPCHHDSLECDLLYLLHCYYEQKTLKALIEVEHWWLQRNIWTQNDNAKLKGLGKTNNYIDCGTITSICRLSTYNIHIYLFLHILKQRWWWWFPSAEDNCEGETASLAWKHEDEDCYWWHIIITIITNYHH